MHAFSPCTFGGEDRRILRLAGCEPSSVGSVHTCTHIYAHNTYVHTHIHITHIHIHHTHLYTHIHIHISYFINQRGKTGLLYQYSTPFNKPHNIKWGPALWKFHGKQTISFCASCKYKFILALPRNTVLGVRPRAWKLPRKHSTTDRIPPALHCTFYE